MFDTRVEESETPLPEDTPENDGGSKANDLLEQLQRERADFSNFRKRAAQERNEESERARAEQLTLLLPVLDDLQRALGQVPSELQQHPWAQGVALGQGKLLEFLSRSGLVPIGSEGEPFDPGRHEAVHFEERPDLDDSVVVTVLRPGYRIGKRILRPATVAVGGPPTNAGSQDSATSFENRID